CVESNKKSPVSFFIENIEELNRIFQDASQKFNLQLISIFHSHPAGAYPSGADLRNMEFLDNFENRAFRNQIWTIMDATNKKINGFIFFNKELMQINVEINKK
ncbi:MAG: Mov34/MPN/PAD-1 family protein, partial [Promethearchaeota archaeon]